MSYGDTGTRFIGELEEAIDSLQDRLANVERVGAKHTRDIADLNKRLGDSPTPEPEPLAVVLRLANMADGDSWSNAGGEYLEAVAPGPTLVVPVSLAAGDYELWARVRGPRPDADAIQVHLFADDLQREWRVFPRQLNSWEVVRLGSLTLRGEYEVGLEVAEVGALIDAMVFSPIALRPEEVMSLMGPVPEVSDPDEDEQPEPEPDPEPEPEPEPDPEPEPPVDSGFSNETHLVAPLVDERFDPKNPTRRTGEKLSAQELVYYRAVERAALRSDPSEYTDIVFNLGRDSSYHLGRHGQTAQVPAALVLARTGDGRLLDQLVRGWRGGYQQLTVEWNPKTATLKGEKHSYVENNAGARISNGRWVLDGKRTPWSPHKKWLYEWGEPSAGRGTDLNNLQTIKPWAVLAQFLVILELNRKAKSPAGFDYGAEADRWKPVLKGFIDAYTSDTGAAWEDNYRGLDGGMFWGKSRTRAKPGQWPFFVRGEGHAIYNSALLCYYCGVLGSLGWDIPNWRDAFDGADLLMEHIRSEFMVPSEDAKGRPSLLVRGGSGWAVMKATYTAYVAWELQAIRDIGRWRGLFDREAMLRVSRAYADMIKPDGSTFKNIAAGVDRTGHGMNVEWGSARTAYQNAVNGFSVPLIWSDDDYLHDTATQAQTRTQAGGYGDSAKCHPLPAAQFIAASGVW